MEEAVRTRRYTKTDYYIYHDSTKRLGELDREIAALDRQIKALKRKHKRAEALAFAKEARSKRFWRRGYRRIRASVS